MNRAQILTIGLILILGLGACTPKTNTAETSTGFAPPTDSRPPASPPLPTSPAPPLPASTAPSLPISIAPPLPSSPAPSATSLACWQAGGRIEQRQFQSTWLPDPLKYRVYTPPCYHQQPDRRYSVLYLLHGQTYNDDQWDRLGADEIADALIGSGEIEPVIIVMPNDSDNYISPPKNLFGEALIHDLLPRIDTDYRTLPDREQRAIGGLSRGGNWAVHLGLSYWEFFGAIGAHSTPIFVHDDQPLIREWLVAIPLDKLPRIYLDAGANDRWLSSILQFEELLHKENIPHEWHLFPGYHDEEYWQPHVEQYLRWYVAEW